MTQLSNRTLFTGDNLPILRGMNSDSVDLIYLDPPFNSNATYSAPVGSAAAGAAFKDSWTLDDVDAEWHGQIADEHPALYKVIDGAGAAYSKGMQAYLIMMGVRMIEMERILRPTGSIYLHCDPTAGAYLKTLMDAVFGRKRFRNEVVWSYRRWPAKHPNFQRMHDTILRYAGEGATWNQQYEPLAASTRKTFGTKRQVADFSSGHRKPSTTAQESPGAPMRDVWSIGVIAPVAKERCGYPTQKPLSLLERIITASSNEGDYVFDPFCGCATTLVAAERLSRKGGGPTSPTSRSSSSSSGSSASWADCSSMSSIGRTSPSARIKGSCPTIGVTLIDSTASRRGTARLAGRTSRSESCMSITSRQGLRAAAMNSPTSRCCAPAAMLARAPVRTSSCSLICERTGYCKSEYAYGLGAEASYTTTYGVYCS